MHPQADILTITLNPAVDLATNVAEVIAGPKLRCAVPRFDPGGGGVNVARAVCKLDGSARALVAVGGAMGDRLLQLLAAENVPALPVAVSGETRQSFAVTDDSTGAQFRFSVPGELMTPTDAGHLLAAIAEQIPQDGFVVISGSVAPGLPIDFLSQIIAVTAPKGARVIIDTSGAALDRLIAHPATPVHLLRVDQNEAAQAATHPMTTIADSVAFAAELLARGVAKTVVMGRGAEGSVLVSQNHRFFSHPPHVKVRSKIGAGDAFVGAMTLALARGKAPCKALQWGVAAASATVSTKGTALCNLTHAEACFAKCQTDAL
ncbi:1-phosphofructokinase family hexose kinase [Yoonia sp. F2084L]|uniref:1-phosphofructokinase family hexose kinase n=1 Tax=Yoonia sp. F2084L TaxID=2926419 RepID=UPI001FF494AF|nr:1-phosphofructokinase family hexose kinase [Yoonia sp. F2084L]MCK0097397.1 1-phosphofructokinase family hexose kinase [Yoonia sp. F2084L]